MGFLTARSGGVLQLHAKVPGMTQVRREPRPAAVTAASWCGPVPGVTRARPPAVAVIGLRRSGRTGNGESPAGASRPPASPDLSVHARFGSR